jgi:hypothetical protein
MEKGELAYRKADAKCFKCTGLFLNDHDGQVWIRCVMCKKWTNAGCSNSDKNQSV